MKIILQILLLLISGSAGAQAWTWFDLESEYYSGIEQISIDTLNKSNSWQIGPPNKNVFTEASSIPNAIVTDTINSYPINDTSVFFLTHYRVTYDETYMLMLSFNYQVNSDTIVDYGIIEASFDGGISWINLIEDYEAYDFEWYSGKPNFSGNTNGWKSAEISILSALEHFPHHDSIVYKFSFISDSVQTEKDGWILDNFGLFDWLESIDENSNSFSKVYPNPASKKIFLEFNNIKHESCRIEVLNMNGQIVKAIETTNSFLEIELHGLSKGIYIYTISAKDGEIFSNGKLIKAD